MARGGTRAGAGRPKGARNKRTEQQEAAIKESGLTPLEFLTSVYRDTAAALDTRIDAAKAAAPYVHAKLSSVELSGRDGEAIEMATTIELIGVRSGDEG